MITPLPGALNQTRNCNITFFGLDAAILDETGKCKANEGGRLVIRKP